MREVGRETGEQVVVGEDARRPLPRCDLVQHGVGDKGARSKVTGERVAGPETLAPQELAKNRADPGGEAARRQLVDDYYRARMVDFEKALQQLNRRRASGQVIKSLERYMPADARVGSVGFFTVP